MTALGRASEPRAWSLRQVREERDEPVSAARPENLSLVCVGGTDSPHVLPTPVMSEVMPPLRLG